MVMEFEVRRAYNQDAEQNFVAVSNGKGHGCDVYEDGDIIDWQDGNGILAHDEATKEQVAEAAAAAMPKIEEP